ncbi:RNA-binding protein [Helicobacter aurati]|uniref:RNA-binding protein n=1 Tax=Helicobacter aurati TaxID=137778 RepID=A0A3D8IWG3_9HELI|nr:RNA-binding protein [Helicobacter aurati]RDU69373.1 RNA-binding protein [Helicobacter aurati]
MQSIYVGNLPCNATEQQVIDLFAQYGDVLSIKIIKNKQKRYAFVEMENNNAHYAIQSLHQTVFLEQTLKVSNARKKFLNPNSNSCSLI